MNEINKILLGRLELLAGEKALLQQQLADSEERAAKYRKWWSTEQETTTRHEKSIAGLEAKGNAT